jgi:hypothetical protein
MLGYSACMYDPLVTATSVLSWIAVASHPSSPIRCISSYIHVQLHLLSTSIKVSECTICRGMLVQEMIL